MEAKTKTIIDNMNKEDRKREQSSLNSLEQIAIEMNDNFEQLSKINEALKKEIYEVRDRNGLLAAQCANYERRYKVLLKNRNYWKKCFLFLAFFALFMVYAAQWINILLKN